MQFSNTLFRLIISFVTLLILSIPANAEDRDSSKLVDALNSSWEAIQDSSSLVADIEATFPSIADSFSEANSVSRNLARQISRIDNRLQNLTYQSDSLGIELLNAAKTQSHLSRQVSDLLPQWKGIADMLPLGTARVGFAEESIQKALQFIRENNFHRGSPQLDGFEDALDNYRRSLMNLESAQRDFRRQHQYLLLSEPKITRIDSWLSSTKTQLDTAPEKLDHIKATVTKLHADVESLSESTRNSQQQFDQVQEAVATGKNQLRSLYYRILILETEYLGSGETKTLLLDDFSKRNIVADLQQQLRRSDPSLASAGPERHHMLDHQLAYPAPSYAGSTQRMAARNIPEEISSVIRIMNAVSTQLQQLTDFVRTQVQHGESIVRQIDNHSVSVANLQRQAIEMGSTIQQITGEAEFMREEIEIQQAQFNLVRSRIENEIQNANRKLATLKQSIETASSKVANFATLVQADE